MNKWFRLAVVSLLWLLAGFADMHAQTPASSESSIIRFYPESDKGFRNQLNDIVECYRSNDEQRGRQLIEGLQLVNAQQWFVEHLGAERSEQATVRYQRLFDRFSGSLEKTVQSVVARRDAKILIDPGKGEGEHPTISAAFAPYFKLSGVVSIKQPQYLFVVFEIELKGRKTVSWGDEFVYEDGSFRYIGGGASPFWVWVEGTEGVPPPEGYFIEPVQVVKQIPPDYPLIAKRQRLGGTVRIHVVVDKEGHVKFAKALVGHPLLIEAALAAVRKWEFHPAVRGGQPIESDITVDVNFSL